MINRFCSMRIRVSSHPREHCERQASYRDLKLGTTCLRELGDMMQKSSSRSVSDEYIYPSYGGVYPPV